jgi:hypothetical protein
MLNCDYERPPLLAFQFITINCSNVISPPNELTIVEEGADPPDVNHNLSLAMSWHAGTPSDLVEIQITRERGSDFFSSLFFLE